MKDEPLQGNGREGASPIVALVELHDAERVMQEIHEKYGFWVTPEYAADLIAFVDAMTAEDPYRTGL